MIAIGGVVRLLYQDFAHIARKHNFIYDPVYIKHGGWQFQELQYIVPLCWWPAVNIAACLPVIWVQSLYSYLQNTVYR